MQPFSMSFPSFILTLIMVLSLVVAAPVGDMKNDMDMDMDMKDSNNNNEMGMDKRQTGTLDYLTGAQGNPAVGALGNLAPHGNIMDSVKKIPIIGALGNFGSSSPSPSSSAGKTASH
ncbi:hypothetical protein VTN77DRAFT_7985 [Rasamsonia byssochlamydoides]|uniref:uncharacterized protein n=1 Tax=Rasamsonia byssochlamydoides TaxID=89139 RepID=UPI00374494A0